MNALKPEIVSGDFCVIGIGDGYDSKVVKGTDLVTHIAKLLYDDKPSVNELQEIVSDLNNEDRWSHFDGDMQYDHYNQDVGEIGGLEIYRMTNTP